MTKDDCSVCRKRVTTRAKAVACERCATWLHVSCVFGVMTVAVLNGVLDVLDKRNIAFTCDHCLDTPKDEDDDKIKVDASSQTEEATTTEPAEGTRTEKERTPTAAEGTRTEKERTTPATQPEDEDAGRPAAVAPVTGGRVATPVPRGVEMVRRSPIIRIVGDSMIRHAPRHVGCSHPGSSCTSLPGARVHDVKDKVKEVAKDMEGGLLVIQGGGNDLKRIGVDETVREVMDAVKAAEKKKISVAVVGVLRRPREDVEYERLRRATNRRIFEEVTRTKVQWMREKSGNVSFLDLDRTLDDDSLYARDGVHLNAEGNARMGRRLREWVKARSVCRADVA